MKKKSVCMYYIYKHVAKNGSVGGGKVSWGEELYNKFDFEDYVNLFIFLSGSLVATIHLIR